MNTGSQELIDKIKKYVMIHPAETWRRVELFENISKEICELYDRVGQQNQQIFDLERVIPNRIDHYNEKIDALTAELYEANALNKQLQKVNIHCVDWFKELKKDYDVLKKQEVDYTVLYEYASENRVSYNELCTVVRKATGL